MPRTTNATPFQRLSPPTDEIVRRAQAGDKQAFEMLYEHSAPAVLRLCRRRLGDEREARDAVQDTFVRAWERLGTFRGDSSIDTWLHRIALNVALRRQQTAQRDARRLTSDGADAAQLHAHDVPADARMDLDAALARLAPGARDVLALHMEGYSHGEIAQLTGTTPGTARAQLWRARQTLARVLGLGAASIAAIAALLVWQSSRPSSTNVATGADSTNLLLVADSVRSYEEEARVLLDQLELQRARLRPEARASLDRDLAVIDRAIAELQHAIANDPRNPALRRMLAASYRQKVELLTRADNAM